MSDITEQILDGTLCEVCGEYLGPPTGKPGRHDGCVVQANARVRRSHNQEIIFQAETKLKAKGIEWRTSNGGVHMQLITMEGMVDLWPTTAKWSIRSKKKRGFGLDNLLKELKNG